MEAQINWFQLVIGLFGGLALFLFGLEQLSEGLKKVAGKALGAALAKLTTNRFTGAIAGAFVTAVLNSSTVTTVLVVGFVTAGLMTLAQSVGVIMGANIGSTFTAQLLAFNISAYALLPVAVGFLMLFAARSQRVRDYGMMLMGIGLVFYGMSVMSDSMKPLRTYQPFVDMLIKMESPLGGILAGAVFTALIHSSAATIGITIAMAAEGLLSLEAGILIALGANIGTCATALIAAIGKPVEAVRAAMVHLLFNVLGVIVWLPLLSVLTALAIKISPVSVDLEPAARAAADVPRQLANANTLFNVLNTVLFIGFTGLFARIAERLVPARAAKPGAIAPKFLDEAALELPSVALQNVRRELGRSGDIAISMLEEIGPALRDRDLKRCEIIIRHDNEVDLLEIAILHYLSLIRQQSLSEVDSLEVQKLMSAVIHLENLADIVKNNLVEIVRKAGEAPPQADEVTPIVEGLYQTVSRAVTLAVRALRDVDAGAAAEVESLKPTIREQAQTLTQATASRLGTQDEKQLVYTRLRMEAAGDLQRIYALARRLAESGYNQETNVTH